MRGDRLLSERQSEPRRERCQLLRGWNVLAPWPALLQEGYGGPTCTERLESFCANQCNGARHALAGVQV